MATPSDPNAQDPRARPSDDARAGFSDAEADGKDLAHDLRDKVAGAGERLTEKAGEAVDSALSHVEGLAADSKDAGAEQLSGVASAFLTAADDLDSSSPEIARHVRSAAEAIDGISGAIRERSAGQLLQDLSGFARRQPTAFFGITVMAGFALARFAKSSTEQSPARPRRHDRSSAAQDVASGSMRRDVGSASAPMTAGQASLRGAAAQQHGKGAGGPIPTGSRGTHEPAAGDRATRPAETREASTVNDQSGAMP
ncbi:hypothetical protein [Elioraea rosea]|uniref:hypothetical protein n=1 Tax=Elioraea rosea TaxID=2492390 RepID=UPI001182733F|nr:hypothetical protein [Elioraea rosea]